MKILTKIKNSEQVKSHFKTFLIFFEKPIDKLDF